MSNANTPRGPLCAVENCTGEGRPHLCPADGAYHGHGCIHYEHCHSDLKFRRDGRWHFVCDAHYVVLVDARTKWARDQNDRRSRHQVGVDPSYDRELDALTRQVDEGEITPEQYVERSLQLAKDFKVSP